MHVVPPGDNYQGFSGMDDRGATGKFGNPSGGPEGSANGTSAGQGGISVPDFLPPAQRLLFMRIQQKQQEEEERARRMAEGGAEKSRETEGRRTEHVHPFTHHSFKHTVDLFRRICTEGNSQFFTKKYTITVETINKVNVN